MRLFTFVFLILGLAACDAAGPGFRGADMVKVSEGGMDFTLRRRGNFVEAIRTNSTWLPKFQEVAPQAGIAAQKASGCRADWVMGDPAMMIIGLECDGHTAPPLPSRKHTLFCDFIAAGQGRLEMECVRG